MSAEPALEQWRSSARDLLHGASGIEEDAGMAVRCYLEQLPTGPPSTAGCAAEQAAMRAAVVAAFVADVRDAAASHGPNRLRDVLMTLAEAAATESQEQPSPSAHETVAHCSTAAAIAEMLCFATVTFVERKTAALRGKAPAAQVRDPAFRGCCSWVRGTLDQLRALTGTVCLPDASAQVSLDPNAASDGDEASAAATQPAEALAHVLFAQASQSVATLAAACRTVWTKAAAVLIDLGAAAMARTAGSSDDPVLQILGPVVYASLAAISASAAAVAQSRPLSDRARELAAVTVWLEASEGKDAERTAVSEDQRRRIAERRERIAASRQARAATPSSGGCCGGLGAAAHSKELSDWTLSADQQADGAALQNELDAAFTEVCAKYVTLRRQGFFVSSEALRASAPLAFLARAVGAASGDSAAVEDSAPSTAAARRQRAYEDWVSSRSLPNALRAASAEGDSVEVDMVAFARGDRSAVGRALAEEQQSASAARKRQALLADLCTDSDAEEEGDDAEGTAAITSYDDEALTCLTTTSGVWYPPLNAEGLGVLGLLDPPKNLTPRARFERVVLPCIGLLRSSSAAAKASGIIALGAVVRAIPQCAVAIPGVTALSDLVSSACGPANDDEAPTAKDDGDALDDMCSRLLSSCEDASLHRYFLLLQELVNTMVSCPAEGIRRPASLLLPVVLRVFPEDVALRLTFALIHRCPYASGTADLIARVLKRAVELSTASCARAINEAAGDADLRAIAVAHLTGAGRSAWLSPAAPWLLAAVAKRWAQSAGSIDMHGDAIVAALNLVRYWTAVDRRYLCGSVLLASAAADVPEKPYSLALHADRTVLACDFTSAWPSGSSTPLKPCARSACRAITDTVLSPVRRWLSRRQNGADLAASSQGQGPPAVSVSGSALGSFALESAAAGLADDFGISQCA